MNTDQKNPEWAAPTAVPANKGLPLVILPTPGVDCLVSEHTMLLFKRMAASGQFFVRGGRVVKLKRRREDGVWFLDILDPTEFRSDIERVVVPLAMRNGQPKPTYCSEDLARVLLKSGQHIDLLPPVVGVNNCPLIYEHNGEVKVAGVGYNADLARLVTSGSNPLEVPLDKAVASLLEVVADFAFQSEGDKARAIASFLTPALKIGRFIKDYVPVDVAEADQSQAGKTFRQRLIAAIYNEQLAIVARPVGGVGSPDESFAHQLVAGKPFIQLDNLRGRLDSQYLESFLTSKGEFPCRLPGKPTVTILAGDTFIFITSNGVDTTSDFANRSSIIRIKKQPVGYQYRQYAEGSNILAHIEANQPYYLGCIFAVITRWQELKKPRTKEARHDFREWAQVCDWIVQELFKLPPLMEGHKDAQLRVSNPDLVLLRELALKLQEAGQLNIPQKALDLQSICDQASIPIPGLSHGAGGDADRGLKVIGMCLGRLFKMADSILVEGFRVTRQVVRTSRPDGGPMESKSYVFTRGDQEPPKNVVELSFARGAAPALPGRFFEEAPLENEGQVSPFEKPKNSEGKSAPAGKQCKTAVTPQNRPA